MERFIQEVGPRSSDHIRSDSVRERRPVLRKAVFTEVPRDSQVRLNHSQGCNWSTMVGQAGLQLPRVPTDKEMLRHLGH